MVDRGRRLRKMDTNAYANKLRAQIIRNSVKDAETECWEWVGTKQANGYGSTRMYGAPTPAHRASFFAFSLDQAEGMDVCHKCDNRSCVNPSHLYKATHAQNMKDMSAKGRGRNGVMSGAFIPARDHLGQFIGKLEA